MLLFLPVRLCYNNLAKIDLVQANKIFLAILFDGNWNHDISELTASGGFASIDPPGTDTTIIDADVIERFVLESGTMIMLKELVKPPSLEKPAVHATCPKITANSLLKDFICLSVAS